ncbi:MAG: TetR/AcrR family transcriptional regulator [Methanobrevibacter sp.]|nr:TetR/AcrR family transcriptional regulator [Methanobrevibacter sp.]
MTVNKDKIFEISIELFSEYGYDGVSIRQIAKKVGIKESSIYNHYKSKESILDAILEFYINEMTNDEIPLSKADENLDVSFDYFYKVGLELYMSKLKNPTMMKITRLILIESYHNEKINRFLKMAMIDGPINGWMELFDLMKTKKLIKSDCNSRHLAESFYYYGFFLIYQHFIVNYPEDDEEFLKELSEKSKNQIQLIYNSVKAV